MQAAGNEFFAGPGFTLNRHIGVGGGEARDLGFEALDLGCSADDYLIDAGAMGKLCLQGTVFDHESAHFECAAGSVGYHFGGERIFC